MIADPYGLAGASGEGYQRGVGGTVARLMRMFEDGLVTEE